MTIHLQADDAGIGKQATTMILDAWKLGLLNGFGIVANPDCLVQIQEALSENRSLECVLCAHLNITDGVAIGGYSNTSILAAPDGKLQIGFVQALKILLMGGVKKRQFLTEVFNEWNAQLAFISKIASERKITAINGHNYVHMLPSLFKIATQLGQKYNIPYIRFVNEPLLLLDIKDIFRMSFYINLCKLFALWLCKMDIQRRKIVFSALSEETFGVLYSGRITAAAVKKNFKKATQRNVNSLEIVFHPGQSKSDEMEKWTSLAGSKKFFTHSNRKQEWDTLSQLQSEHVFTNND